jgi:hypothetical protein
MLPSISTVGTVEPIPSTSTANDQICTENPPNIETKAKSNSESKLQPNVMLHRIANKTIKKRKPAK